MKAGYEYYKETVKSGDDTLSNIINNGGDGIGKAAEEIGRNLKEMFNAAKPAGEDTKK
jgi:hypothetical protein